MFEGGGDNSTHAGGRAGPCLSSPRPQEESALKEALRNAWAHEAKDRKATEEKLRLGAEAPKPASGRPVRPVRPQVPRFSLGREGVSLLREATIWGRSDSGFPLWQVSDFHGVALTCVKLAMVCVVWFIESTFRATQGGYPPKTKPIEGTFLLKRNLQLS